jgi:hypothetical protein
MSITNLAVLQGVNAANVEVVGVGSTQATATRLTHKLTRIIKSVGSGAFILPSILSGEASEPMIVVNDTGASVNVFPFIGEKTGGTVNAAFAIAGGASGICVPVLNSPNNPTTLDWRCGLIT